MRDFPSGPVAKTPTPNAGGWGLIPGQGTRSRMLQLKISRIMTKIEDPTYLNHELAQPNK